MYTVKCDGYPLLDFRLESLILHNPKVTVEVNTVGGGSFTIYNNHPYYHVMQKMKSIVEVADEYGVIFRGRITDDTIDFNNGKAVDLEGLMAFFNDSIVRPYIFPDDFLGNDEYTAAAESGNVIEYFLKWLIDNHNSQVEPFQQFKLGRVTVSDPNNYLTRSDTGYNNTWSVLSSKLFGSKLGGYLCIRYETDGNYIDYLKDFELTNVQEIHFGENLLDIKTEIDASTTYSAIIPLGAEIKSAENSDIKNLLTISSLPDGDITEDIVKSGDTLYSKKAVEAYGWIYAPVSETTWEDVTEVDNLLTNGKNYLTNTAVMLANTVEITAVDLHYADSLIESFRIYRNIRVKSEPHEHEGIYQLTKLDLDLINPQNTKITVGNKKLTLTDMNSQQLSTAIDRIQTAEKNIEETRQQTTEIQQQVVIETTEILNTCNEIILGALESYVKTSNYEEFKETVETQLSILAGEIVLKFETTTEHIENVNGDLQLTVDTLGKYFEFTEKGLKIKSGSNDMSLTIDNDVITFEKNGQQFGWWDGVDFHTGNIFVNVDEKAQFGNFAFVPRSDGSLSFLKVGE